MPSSLRRSRSLDLALVTAFVALLAGCPEAAQDDADSASGTMGDASQGPGSADADATGAGGVDTDADADAGATTGTPTGGATDAATTDDDGDSGTRADDGTAGSTTDEATDGTGSGSETGDMPLSDDPFDPAACNGVPWTAADAAAQLGGLDRLVLANATIQVRTRMCAGEVCDPWGPGDDWWIHYLTYSGGVVTAYKDFLADMNLVLFDDGGTPRLSMQHVTFPDGGYPDDDGVLYDFPPAPVNYPHLRAYDVAPDSQYYYQDLDYQVSDGVLVLGDGCAVWTANPYGTGTPYTAQYGIVFHW